jgi:hypothetical protein
MSDPPELAAPDADDPKASRRNWLILGAVVIAGGVAAWQLSRVVHPPERCIVYVVTGADGDALVQARGEELTPTPAGRWKKYGIPAKIKEEVPFVVTPHGEPPIFCTFGNGIHIITTTSDGKVTWEDIRYGSNGTLGLVYGLNNKTSQHVVRRGCEQVSGAWETVLYDFDTEPPEKIEVQVKQGEAPLPVDHIKLRR